MFDQFLRKVSLDWVMGNTEDKPVVQTSDGPVGPDGKKLKPCCACPETKKARDECILLKGEEHCSELIEAHKVCMRKLGFKV
ncbi:UNVERIFIED_CONTAM: hypothetical protein PYX00_003011 [Menopon gallinae]|uniref:Cytochrome c oxidase copper chaperone n=1 Tax=Menopon gallinae TaxID=328185 RepID=A0AAW2HYC6_9NEOP